MKPISAECHHRAYQYLTCLLACVAGRQQGIVQKIFMIYKNISGCGSLSMKGLSVPGQLILGSSADLVCNYALAGSKLYSVKWYKDGQEFFRFMPSMDTQIEVFPVRGVSVDVSKPSFLNEFYTSQMLERYINLKLRYVGQLPVLIQLSGSGSQLCPRSGELQTAINQILRNWIRKPLALCCAVHQL